MDTGLDVPDVPMSQGQVRVVVDDAALQKLVETGDIDAAVSQAAHRARFYAEANILEAGRVDTGEMIHGIQINKIRRQDKKSEYQVISTAKHSMFNEKGRGPIVGNPLLVFKPKGSSKFVFARRVKGVKGIHFMERALKAIKASDFKFKG